MKDRMSIDQIVAVARSYNLAADLMRHARRLTDCTEPEKALDIIEELQTQTEATNEVLLAILQHHRPEAHLESVL